MRSVGKVLLSLALVACVAQAANAEAYLWWQLSSSPAPATLPATRTLNLDQDQNTTQTWSLDLYMYTGATEIAKSYSVRLYRPLPTGTADLGLSVTTFQYLYPGWTVQSPVSPTLNSGNYLIQSWGAGMGANDVAMPSATVQKISHVEIQCVVGALGSVHPMSMAVGTGRFAHSPSGYITQVYFGDSAAVNGGTVNALGNVPVINITAIPEPATLVLLGFGLVGLLRRR